MDQRERLILFAPEIVVGSPFVIAKDELGLPLQAETTGDGLDDAVADLPGFHVHEQGCTTAEDHAAAHFKQLRVVGRSIRRRLGAVVVFRWNELTVRQTFIERLLRYFENDISLDLAVRAHSMKGTCRMDFKFGDLSRCVRGKINSQNLFQAKEAIWVGVWLIEALGKILDNFVQHALNDLA